YYIDASYLEALKRTREKYISLNRAYKEIISEESTKDNIKEQM
ncbi:5748_t:CDS:1, partial [Scutellospora calospora]